MISATNEPLQGRPCSRLSKLKQERNSKREAIELNFEQRSKARSELLNLQRRQDELLEQKVSLELELQQLDEQILNFELIHANQQHQQEGAWCEDRPEAVVAMDNHGDTPITRCDTSGSPSTTWTAPTITTNTAIATITDGSSDTDTRNAAHPHMAHGIHHHHQQQGLLGPEQGRMQNEEYENATLRSSVASVASVDSLANDDNGIQQNHQPLQQLQQTQQQHTQPQHLPQPQPQQQCQPQERHTYLWTKQVQHMLQRTFKISAFRNHQHEVINATLSQQDVFCIMRTGGGKSLTYQLPALLEGRGTTKRITFVVSPTSFAHSRSRRTNESIISKKCHFLYICLWYFQSYKSVEYGTRSKCRNLHGSCHTGTSVQIGTSYERIATPS